MAVIKLLSTKKISSLLQYADKRAEVKSNSNIFDERQATKEMYEVRKAFNKNTSVQGHHIIQSFSPEDKVSPEQANEIGRQLAEKVAIGHQVMIYTHADKNHIHNHIVINSVHPETGKKYHSDRKKMYEIKEISNDLCRAEGLSIIKEPTEKATYKMAEVQLLERGEIPYKEHLRQAIDFVKTAVKTLEEMREKLKEKFQIEMKIQNKNVSFKAPDRERFVRGKTLGSGYTKEALVNELERQFERGAARDAGRNDNTDIGGSTTSDTGNRERADRLTGSERTLSRLEKFSEYTMGQKRPSQEPVRTNDDRSNERNESNTRAVSRTLETNTAEKQRDQRAISSSPGEQQPSKSKGSKSHSKPLSEERERNRESIGSHNKIGADQRARKENGDKGKTPTVRDHSRVEHPGLDRSEPPMDGSEQLKPKVDKSKERGMDFDR